MKTFDYDKYRPPQTLRMAEAGKVNNTLIIPRLAFLAHHQRAAAGGPAVASGYRTPPE